MCPNSDVPKIKAAAIPSNHTHTRVHEVLQICLSRVTAALIDDICLPLIPAKPCITLSFSSSSLIYFVLIPTIVLDKPELMCFSVSLPFSSVTSPYSISL